MHFATTRQDGQYVTTTMPLPTKDEAMRFAIHAADPFQCRTPMPLASVSARIDNRNEGRGWMCNEV